MKIRRICTFLLIALLCVFCGAARAEGRVTLKDSCFFRHEDGTYVLHLLLSYEGDTAFALEGVRVSFLDANGSVIEMEKIGFAAVPMPAVPAGKHAVPVTMWAVAPAGTEVASWRLEAAEGVAREDFRLTEYTGPEVGRILIQGSRWIELTAFLPDDGQAAPQQYAGYGLLWGSGGEYLGCVPLTPDMAAAVEGEDMMDALAAATGIPTESLQDMGFSLEKSDDSLLFSMVPLTLLETGKVPASITISVFRPELQPHALEVVGFSLDKQEDGRVTICGLLRNSTDGMRFFRGIGDVALQDELGNVRLLQNAVLDTPFRSLASGEIVPFVITGWTDEAFEPVGCGFQTESEPTEIADHVQLQGASSQTEADGEMRFTPVIALQEGTDPADYGWACVMMDMNSGDILDCVWTLPGEGWVQDGSVRLPSERLDIPGNVTVALVQLWYRLQ